MPKIHKDKTDDTSRTTSTVSNNTITINKIEYDKLQNENTRLKLEVLILQEKVDLLTYKRFVHSSEKQDGKQPFLFNEEEQIKEESKENKDTEPEIQVRAHTRKPGRKPLPENLRREVIVNDLSDDEKHCECGAELVKIGEEVSARLVVVPAQIYVEKTVTPKYVCTHCRAAKGDADAPASIKAAQALPAILPGSIATVALLVYIFIAKFCDGLPYYRLEKQFERIGVSISRQDMANWQVTVFEKLTKLLKLMMAHIKKGKVLRMDETTVQVMGEDGRDDKQKSYIWLARGGPPDKIVTILEYKPTRASDNIDEWLDGFQGYLQTDGYSGYDCALGRHIGIIHVGCFAHARRKFFEALKVGSQAKSAAIGITYIKKLYTIEDELRDSESKLSYEDFVLQRKKKAMPILDEFKKWIDKLVSETKAETLLQKAVNYTYNQWDKLVAYLGCAELTPDNNLSENAIRPFVIGRKNWLFFKSPEGAKSGCALYSLIETAKCNGVDPARYLTYLFEKVPTAVSDADWSALLPWNVKLDDGRI
jgi:transposase